MARGRLGLGVLVSLFWSVGCSSESGEGRPQVDVLTRISALPHVVSAQEYFDAPGETMKAVATGYRRFDVTFDQPVDHDHPEGEHFTQRLTVLHKSTDAPTVLATSGYHLRSNRGEVAVTLSTNQVNVEHRYFGPSTPKDGTFRYLDARQSAFDFHTITESLKALYPAKWLGSGASKGGATALFHRYYFPEDTNGTVAYVAPLLRSVRDDRFPPFLREVGGAKYADCRAKLFAFQKTVLRRREEIKPLIHGTYAKIGGLDVAIEHGTFEFYFGFWQYADPADAEHGCDAIPADDAAAQTVADFLEETGSLYTNIDDESLDDYAAFYVQSARELGSYAADLTPFAGLITHGDAYTLATYVPAGIPATYDDHFGREVTEFVATRGERLMFIYGEYDPWTAAALTPNVANDSFRFDVKAGNHGSAIRGLTPSEKEAALATIMRWAGLAPTSPVMTLLPGVRPAQFRARFDLR